MHPFLSTAILLATAAPLAAGTVVVTSVPDETRPLQPLGSLDGTPLSGEAEIRIGAFPGMDADALLDSAATGGLAAISAAFVPFGEPRRIGEGTADEEGSFEISVRQEIPDPGSPLVGETISLLIRQGEEILVARFPGENFEADPDTALEPVKSLHLSDARLVLGNRLGTDKLAAGPVSAQGSYDLWIGGFPAISDPALQLPGADADGDGRSNFLEYATGGDPASPLDPPPCQLVREGAYMWVKFRREPGLGTVGLSVESSASLAADWAEFSGTLEPDPGSSGGDDPGWFRMQVIPGTGPAFFRLSTGEEEEP